MKVIFVQGPTASGKSNLALQWAQKFGGVIINCDSIQCYQELNIGSAKPSLQERNLVPHYLFDYVPVGQVQTAGEYCRDFYSVLNGLPEDSRVFVVGGTGFYFQAIEKGMFEVGASDPVIVAQIEKELAEKGADQLYAEIERLDPETAQRFSKNDSYRVVRTLETLRKTQRKVSEIRKEHEAKIAFPYPLMKVGIWGSRNDLEPRIIQRTRQMFKDGLIAEVENLLQRGLGDWKALHSIGYREVVEYLLGEHTENDLLELQPKIVTSTLQLAKRQRTWFQRDPAIRWMSGSNSPGFKGQVVTDISAELSEFLLS
jgi:tRNA dimethylallyltransferase